MPRLPKSTIIALRDDGLTEVSRCGVRRRSHELNPAHYHINEMEDAAALAAFEEFQRAQHGGDDMPYTSQSTPLRPRRNPAPTAQNRASEVGGARHMTHPHTIAALQARVAAIAKEGRILSPSETQQYSSQSQSSVHRRLAELAVPTHQMVALEELGEWRAHSGHKQRGADLEVPGDLSFRDTPSAFEHRAMGPHSPLGMPVAPPTLLGGGGAATSQAPTQTPRVQGITPLPLPYTVNKGRIVLATGASCALTVFQSCAVDEGGRLDLSSPKGPIHPPMSPPPQESAIHARAAKSSRLAVGKLSDALAAAVYGNTLRETAERNARGAGGGGTSATDSDSEEGADEGTRGQGRAVVGASGFVTEDQIARLMHNPKRVSLAHIPSDDYRLLRSLFTEIDTDKSGYLELSELLQYRGQYPRRLPKSMLYRLNLEEDGRVYFDDFLGSFFPNVPRSGIETTMRLHEPSTALTSGAASSSKNGPTTAIDAVDSTLYGAAMHAVYRLYRRISQDFKEFTLEAYVGRTGPFAAGLGGPEQEVSSLESVLPENHTSDSAVSPQLSEFPHLYRSALSTVPSPVLTSTASTTTHRPAYQLLSTRFHPQEDTDSVFLDAPDDRTPQAARFDKERSGGGGRGVHRFDFGDTAEGEVPSLAGVETPPIVNAYQWYLFEKCVVEASRRAAGLVPAPGMMGDSSQRLFDEIEAEAMRLGGVTPSNLGAVESGLPPALIQGFVAKLSRREVALKSVLSPEMRRLRKEQQDGAVTAMDGPTLRSRMGSGRSLRKIGSRHRLSSLRDGAEGERRRTTGVDGSTLLFSQTPMVRCTRRVTLDGMPSKIHLLVTMEPNVPFLLSCPIPFKVFAKVAAGYFLTHARNYAAVEAVHARRREDEDRQLVENREERRRQAAVVEAQRILLAEYRHVQRQQRLLNRMAGRAEEPTSPNNHDGDIDSPLSKPRDAGGQAASQRRLSSSEAWARVGVAFMSEATPQQQPMDAQEVDYAGAVFARSTMLASTSDHASRELAPQPGALTRDKNTLPPRSCVPRNHQHYHTLADYQPSNPAVTVVVPYSPAFEERLQAMQWHIMYPYTGTIRSYFAAPDSK